MIKVGRSGLTNAYTDNNTLQTATTTFAYTDSANPGLITAITTPKGNTNPPPQITYTTQYTYFNSSNPTEAGMLASVTDPAGDITTYAYDAVGRQTSMVAPNGNAPGGVPANHTWSYTYENEDRLLAVSAPAPSPGGNPLVTQYQYDNVGNRTVVIDANGQVTQYKYDARDSLAEVDQSPEAWTVVNSPPATVYVTKYTYDNLGNLRRVTRAQGDPNGNERATDYTYDGRNRLRSETQYPAWPTTTPTLTTTYTYDLDGNLLTTTDPLNQVTTNGYDHDNRLTAVTYSQTVNSTPNVTYGYDANGNRTQMSDGTGSSSYAYDEMDRLTSVTNGANQTVSYRYDVNGNLSVLTYPDTTAASYGYDGADRLTSLTDWASRQVSYAYNWDSTLKTQTNVFNGTSATYSYDDAQRLNQVLNQHGTTTIGQHSYTLDSLGNRTAVSETLAQVSGNPIANNVTYTLDHLYRLTSDGTRSYQYDPVGNRVLMTQGSTNTTYTVDKADRLTAVNSTPYTSDADGNLTQAGTDQASYDAANRLIRIFDGTTTTTYVYDGDGLRTSKTSGSATTNYTWDPNRANPVVLADSTYKYVYGLGLVYAVTSGGSLGVYHTDGLGSVRAITDANGNLVEAYLTDAFGVSLGSEGTVTQPFGFTGQQQDSESGLYYLRARYYSPTLGRFISRDSTFGSLTNPLSLNRFGYALDNPGLLVDPSGLSANKVTQNTADDNQCFSNAGGQAAGNYVFATCTDTPLGIEALTVVDTPLGPWVVPTVFLAKPPGASDGESGDPYEVAKSGGRNAGLLRTYAGKSIAEIQKAIGSLATRAAEHLDKAANPEGYITDWATKDSREQQGLVRYWLREADNYSQQAQVLTGLLNRLGGSQ